MELASEFLGKIQFRIPQIAGRIYFLAAVKLVVTYFFEASRRVRLTSAKAPVLLSALT